MRWQKPVRVIKSRKVIHVVTALDFGGDESMMFLMAQNGKASHYVHEFCAISRGGWASGEIESMGFRSTILGLDPKIPSFRVVLRLVRFFLHERPLIVHSYGAEANFSASIASFLAGVRLRIVHEIGIPRHSRIARIIFAWAYRLSSAVVGVSQTTVDEVVRMGEADREKCEIVWVPVAFAEKPIRPSSSGEIRKICFVGRLEKEKNPLALVQALKALHDSNRRIQLFIYGDGSQRSLLETRCLELGISDSVHFLGFVEHPASVIPEMDLFVQPSLSEGLSLALIEMMSAEVPVLASSKGGGSEVLEDGQNGWLLHNQEAPAIASSILRIAELSPAVRREVGMMGRKSVEKKFAPRAYLERLDDFYSRKL